MSDVETDRLRALMLDVLRRRDTASQRVEAAEVADAYVHLDADRRRRFLHILVDDFGTDRDAVDAAMAAVERAGDDERTAAELALREALAPSFARLLHLFLGLDSGVKFLVDLRADTLRFAREDPDLVPIEVELRGHLTTLFDVGLLELRRITWDAPASLLEKLAAYEAVHEIESWVDMKNRLRADRRWYAFFHPAMPDEPLVFVEVALTRGIVATLDVLLDENQAPVDPEEADTAVFYSISNAQPGLAGVNLGNELIKQVVDELRRELAHLRTFATLSPVPGFRTWLDERLRSDDLRPSERDLLPGRPAEVRDRLGDDDWVHDGTFAAAVRPALLALCARYLVSRRDHRVVDPVANFHLSNGAAIERVDWLANPTPAGLARSAGIMANYLYEPEEISARAEAYAADGHVTLSPEVRGLLED